MMRIRPQLTEHHTFVVGMDAATGDSVQDDMRRQAEIDGALVPVGPLAEPPGRVEGADLEERATRADTTG